MHITIFTAGSQGDLQPCTVLGKALQQAGFHVLMAAPQSFEGLIKGQGFRFHIIDGAPAARFIQRLKELIESGYGLGKIAVQS